MVVLEDMYNVVYGSVLCIVATHSARSTGTSKTIAGFLKEFSPSSTIGSASTSK